MKFSIITVVKNSISNIHLTINSIKQQTYKNYEHIIFDGNSNDGTSQFLKKNFTKKTVYFRESDTGIYNALNKAIKEAKGKYIFILHAGDFFFSKETLYSISNFLDKNKTFDFFSANILFYSQKKNNISRVWYMPFKKKQKLSFLKIPHTSLCVKKNIFKKIIFNEKFKISADTDFILKITKKYKGKYYNKFLIYMENMGLSNSSKNFSLKIKEDLKIFLKEFGLIAPIILIYKLLIKFPGILTNKTKYDKKFKNQFKLLNKIKIIS